MTAPLLQAGVIGWPIRHSRSPLIHGWWLKEHGIAGRYEKHAVAPDDLPAFIRRMRDEGWRGCNATIPHKEAVLALADEATPVSRLLGAANTLWFEGHALHADNTDVAGFIASLTADVPNWQASTRHALVLGAGGAARGIAHGLLASGVETVSLANRSRDRAEQVAALLGPRAQTIPFPPHPAAIAVADLIVNTTSLGMAGQPALDLDLSRLRIDTIVAEIVYVPLETALVSEANRRGCRVSPGLGMLLHQAVPGFARWFGPVPTVTTALRALVEADVSAHG
jgi:shikimate dehydrogenase